MSREVAGVVFWPIAMAVIAIGVTAAFMHL